MRAQERVMRPATRGLDVSPPLPLGEVHDAWPTPRPPSDRERVAAAFRFMAGVFDDTLNLAWAIFVTERDVLTSEWPIPMLWVKDAYGLRTRAYQRAIGVIGALGQGRGAP